MLRASVLPATFLALAAGAMLAGEARGEASSGSLGSVFFVAKSENRNQVHYGVRVDASCAPVGAEPVYAYWRMLEQGPAATEPLLAREVGAYGFAEQRVIESGPAGGRVLVRLRALPGRPIELVTSRRGDGCVATARAAIGGQPAWLGHVYVQLRWPFGVDHLELWGRALADGHPLAERVSN